ncbi:MAG: 16S rRNA (cytosine(1402)-N(4))-methyltransferase RsmH [Pseudomonadota bacterium]|nr:16S rRNA (cytosine(1402)-N(4))-methyltransferase RsmH [Pseudomonadota bacterium]
MDRVAKEDRGYAHIPVMLEEVLALAPAGPAPWILDATFGRGGHSRALLARLGPEARLFALDRDPEALVAARALAAEDPRVTVVASPFGALAEALAPHLQGRGLDGVLMDLGVSSPQLDDPARGFSFRNDGPLDMRMSGEGRSAAEVLAQCEEGELARIFKELGEERFARRIARALVAARESGVVFTRTRQLAEAVAEAHPSWSPDRHPATRVFMALRLHVNDELGQLEAGLRGAVELLAPAGRLWVISFHSLEDRIVKRFLRREAQGEPLPRGLPVRGPAPGVRLRLLGKGQGPSAEELAANPRARSARLRAAERVAA